MEIKDIKGSVVWRLPGETPVYSLQASAGADKFLVSPFDKSQPVLAINGTIRQIQQEDLPGIFSTWVLPDGHEQDSTAQADYIKWVEEAKIAMSQGLLTKVVIARKLWKSVKPDISMIFQALLQHHQNALVYTFMLENGLCMIGATPETLLKREGEVLYTEALGGTMTHAVYSEKETLEHRHISDYVSAILGQHDYSFETGETGIRKAGIVEHLSTPFFVKSKNYEADLMLASTLHPTSAVCGMPYREAFDFIVDTETFDRRYYSGFLGPVHANGNFNLFVNLRCAELYRSGAVLYAGAGLNGMSDPQDEWAETTNKMQTVAHWLHI